MSSMLLMRRLLADEDAVDDDEGIDVVFDLLLPAMVIVLMLGMGASVTIVDLKTVFRAPKPLAIGVCSNFFWMPLLGLALGYMFDLTSAMHVSVIVVATCPGGTTSTLATFWSSGNVALSVAMTSVSTVVAMGLQPLYLWIALRIVDPSNSVKISYTTLVLTLLAVVVPVGIGMLINHRYPEKAVYFTRTGSIVGFFVIFLTIIYGAITRSYLFSASWKVYIIAILLGLAGFSFGYGTSKLVGLSERNARTASIETGIQNGILAIAIVELSFTGEMREQMLTFPLFYSLWIVIESLVLGAVWSQIPVEIPPDKEVMANQSLRLTAVGRDGKGETIYRSRVSADGLVDSLDDGVRTVYDNFAATAKVLPNSACLGTRSATDLPKRPYEWLTYRDVDAQMRELGSGLLSLGVRSGEMVGLFSINRKEWVIGDIACSAYSFVSVPLYDTLGPDAVRYVCDRTAATAVICSADKVDEMLRASERCPALRLIVQMEDAIDPRHATHAVSGSAGLDAGSLLAHDGGGRGKDSITPFENGGGDKGKAARATTKDAGGRDSNASASASAQGAPGSMQRRALLVTMAQVRDLGRREPHDPVPPSPSDMYTICFTSGTTSNPKGVVLTHGSMMASMAGAFMVAGGLVSGRMPGQGSEPPPKQAKGGSSSSSSSSSSSKINDGANNNNNNSSAGSAAGAAGGIGGPFGPSDTHISYLPAAHMFERLIMAFCIARGIKIGFYSGDVQKLTSDMQVLKPTIFCSVPRLLNRVKDKVMASVASRRGCWDAGLWPPFPGLSRWLFEKGYRRKVRLLERNIVEHGFWDSTVFSSIAQRLGGRVRLILTGSAPLPKDTMDFLRVCFSCHVHEGYGQTETSAVISVTLPGDCSVGHVGPVLPCTELKLVDVPHLNARADDPVRPSGEVCVRGPNIFRGYYREPEKTAEVFDEDGWLHTGDVGAINPNGTLTIVDRVKSFFKLAQGEYCAPEKIEGVLQGCRLVAQAFVYGDSLQHQLVAVVVPDMQELIVAVREYAAAASGHTGGHNGSGSGSGGGGSGAGGGGSSSANGGKVKLKDISPSALPERLLSNPESVADYLGEPALLSLVLGEMTAEAKRGGLKGFETPRAVHLAMEPFTVENDQLTPTFKIKRHVLRTRYAAEVDAMYASLGATNGFQVDVKQQQRELLEQHSKQSSRPAGGPGDGVGRAGERSDAAAPPRSNNVSDQHQNSGPHSTAAAAAPTGPTQVAPRDSSDGSLNPGMFLPGKVTASPAVERRDPQQVSSSAHPPISTQKLNVESRDL